MLEQKTMSPGRLLMPVGIVLAFLSAGCLGSSSDSSDDDAGDSGYTGRFITDKGLAWAGRRELDTETYGALFDHYRSLGYMQIDVEARPAGHGQVRYAMVWRENPDGREWRQNRNMSPAGMAERMDERAEQGMRALDVEGYIRGENLEHAAIWVENVEGLKWQARWNLDEQEFSDFALLMELLGYRPIDINVYDTPEGVQWAGVWYENVDDLEWAMHDGMTREQYLQKGDEKSSAGYIMIDYESYRTPAGQLYAGIWVRPNDYGAYQIRTGRNELGYANLFREYADDGYRLVDFSNYNTPEIDRYAGIWIENADRLFYEHKDDITEEIEDHQEEYDTTGISVAIFHDGQLVYRQGFGNADDEVGKVAHGRTVYNAASISKVLGSTLAAKLEAEGELRDGTSVDLDLSLNTSSYLSNVQDPESGEYLGSIPAHHDHTLEELMAHIGCVPHYKDSDNPDDPYIANRSGHYETATRALTTRAAEDENLDDGLEAVWDVDLLPGCTIGEDRNYSTGAFTFIAAAMEQETGRSINQLMREELFEPYGMRDTRVMFETSILPNRYDRAVPYSNNGDPAEYGNNSWKVLGGGIESTPLDLARFGQRLLDGDIVDQDTRDNRLWSPVGSGCNWPSGGKCRNGLGWRVYHSFVEHGGSWTGARSNLRIYPDDDLVIAIMSNKVRDEAGDDGTAQNQRALTAKIANIIGSD